jgi:hypothetical protein
VWKLRKGAQYTVSTVLVKPIAGLGTAITTPTDVHDCTMAAFESVVTILILGLPLPKECRAMLGSDTVPRLAHGQGSVAQSTCC